METIQSLWTWGLIQYQTILDPCQVVIRPLILLHAIQRMFRTLKVNVSI